MTNQEFLEYLVQRVNHYCEHFSLKIGQGFGMWYAVESLGLEEDEAYEAVSYDKSNDKDIDLFFIDDERERVQIGQLKFQKNGKYKAKKGELLSLMHTANWLKDPEALLRDGRKDLADASKQFLESLSKGYSVEYVYIFCGPSHKDVSDTARQINVTEAGNIPSRSCRVVDLPSLVADREEVVSQASRIQNATISLSGEGYEEVGSFGKAYITTLSGDRLAKLHKDFGDRLFDRNVRLFLGARKGGVNASLRDTLESAGDRKNFWAYNNGVTFICDKYQFDTKKKNLTLQNFSIVNGCQTTVSLANSKQEASEEARVLTRFIAAPEKAVDSIIRYTNSQNPIRLWDLTAQDKLQKRLKKSLADLPQPYLYILRKGESRKLDSEEKTKFRRKSDGTLCSIRHDLNAQYLASFRGLPAIAYKDKGTIFASHYNDVFPPQIRPEEVVLVWQAGTVASLLVKHELEEAAANDDLDRIAILKRGAKFFVVAVMGILLHERNGNTFLNVLKGEVATSKKTAERLENYAATALEWYVEAMTDLMVSGVEITTLVRSPDSWGRIKAKMMSKWKVFRLAKKVVEDSLPKL
jgi:hypothetical protein